MSIQRKYTPNGNYSINYSGGSKNRTKALQYLKGGNCGCSNCMTGAGFDVNFLTGSGFFDDISNALPSILKYVPIVGPVLQEASQGVLDVLDPYRQNPQNLSYTHGETINKNPVSFSKGFETNIPRKTPKPTITKNSNPYGGRKIRGSGLADRIFTALGKTAGAVVKTGFNEYTKKQEQDDFNKKIAQLRTPKTVYNVYGSGKKMDYGSHIYKPLRGKGKISDFVNKHKGKIATAGLASLATLAGLAGTHIINQRDPDIGKPYLFGSGKRKVGRPRKQL